MNAPENIKPINLAHEALLKAKDALCIEDVAWSLLGGERPGKSDIRSAAKQLRELARLGIIEMEPRAGGVPFYRLIVAPQMVEIPLVEQKQEVAESDRAVIPPPPPGV